MATPLRRFQNGRDVGNVAQRYTAQGGGHQRRYGGYPAINNDDLDRFADTVILVAGGIFRIIQRILITLLVVMRAVARFVAPILRRFWLWGLRRGPGWWRTLSAQVRPGWILLTRFCGRGFARLFRSSPVWWRQLQQLIAASIRRHKWLAYFCVAGICVSVACWAMAGSSMSWHYAHVLIRTWPASEVNVDGRKAGNAPARLPVRMAPGKHKLQFVAADKTIQPQEIMITLQKDGNIEVNIDLQAHSYNIVDQAK